MSNIGFLSLDLLLIIILFVLLFLISFKFGKKIIVSLIISMYPTLLIFSNLNFGELGLSEKTAQALVFIVLYVLLATVLWKNVSVKKLYSQFRKSLDYSILSLTYVVFLLSIYINSVDYLAPFYTLSGITIEWVSKIPYSLMLVIPIIVIIITNRKDLEK